MSISVFLVQLVVTAVLAGQPAADTATRLDPSQESLEVRYCHFEVPRELQSASLDFSVVYSFSVDESGQVKDLQKVRDAYLDLQNVSSCLQLWKLPSLTVGETYHFASNWQHGVGWTRMSIVGEGLHLTIAPFGDRHPYARRDPG